MNLALLHTPQAGHPPLLDDADRAVFLQETIDLFTRKKQGHLIHRCYLTPEALHWGGAFSSRKESYGKAGELCVIPKAGSSISKLARNAFGVVGIENGAGMRSAMLDKSVPFFSSLAGLHTWVGRELSPASIDIMQEVMGGALPNIRIIPDLADFQKASYPKGLPKGRKVLAEFGLTRGNMQGFPEDGFPYHILVEDMLAHASRLDSGDIYTYTFDCNQNGEEVERSYNSIETTMWGRELFRAMQSELAEHITGDFDPDAFSFRDIWVASAHGGFNYMVADRTMKFEIAGIPVTAHKGEPQFGITNSFKQPLEIAEQLAIDTDYRMKMHLSADRRIAQPAFIRS
jgi:hypothetical protein